MTDTKCPHCGAVCSCIDSTGRYYTCGTSIHDTATHQSDVCALRQLRAKVAAQQELLDDIRNNLYVQTFDTCPPGYAGIINESMLRRLGVKLCDT